MRWSDVLLRLRALVFRTRVERELDEEVEFHLEMARRKFALGGHSPDEAARLARLEFGGVGYVKEDCRRARGTQLIESTWQDIRYALRSFGRNPALVFTVAGTIALGLGVNTALFTLFNAYVLRPIGIQDPYSVFGFTWTDREGLGHRFSWREYEDFRKHNAVFSEVAGSQYLFARSDGHILHGQLVTGNYFQMLGVSAGLGRTLLPEDSPAPGRDPVIVLSYQAWQNLFAGRPDIVGTKLMIRGYPQQVVGVARQGFQGLGESPRDFWAPVTMASRLADGPDLFGTAEPEGLEVVGRLRHGLGVAEAKTILLGWARQMTSQLADDRRAAGIVLRSKATAIPITSEMLLLFTPLVTAFALVLLLACANVANMLLARAMARQREIGIRLSLGAGRGRLIRQLLIESILLSIPAAFAGLVVSQLIIQLGMKAMFATIPPDMVELIRTAPLPLDWRVAAFMLMAALISAFLFGLVPAIQATRSDVMSAARGEFTADFRPVRLRNGLVIAQVTVCTLLLVVCGALVRTTDAMSNFDVGFSTHDLIGMNLAEKGRTAILNALALDPGVEKIAAASSIPLNGYVPIINATASGASTVAVAHNYVSPEYFGLLGIPILRGRNFTREEAASNLPVAILSAAGAGRLFGKTDWAGSLVHIAGAQPRDVRVIGVAADIVTCCIPYGKDAGMIYLPTTPASAERSLLLRVRGNVEAEKQRLDVKLEAAAPGFVSDIHSMDQYHAAGIYPFRAAAWIGFAVGGLALVLTLSGIYGVLSYLVTQRTKEIGIRVALGATTGTVTALVLKQCFRLALFGIGAGTVLALASSRMLASQILFFRSFDAPAFAAGALLVGTASIAAGYFPSRRAARIDPISTLRYE